MGESPRRNRDPIPARWDVASIRARPGMFVGGPEHAALQLFYEVLGNASDQVLGGSARSIEVVLHEDDGVTFRDDGPGIAPDLLARAVRSFHDTPTLDGHRPHAHLGPHSLGLIVVAALSERMEVTTWHQGSEHRLVLNRGIQDPIESRPHVGPTGTKVHYRPDPTVVPQCTLARLHLSQRLTEISDLLDLPITLRDEGWRSLLSRVAGAGALEIKGDEEETKVRAAIAWNGHRAPVVESFMGLQPCARGGTHVTGFLAGLREASKTLGLDLVPGANVCVAVLASDVHWGQPSRDQVMNPEFETIVKRITAKALLAHFVTHPEALEALRSR